MSKRLSALRPDAIGPWPARGILVLTASFTPRLRPRSTQKELQRERVLAGANPVNKPMPGVYARHNALDVPALDPEGKPIDESVSRVLEARHQTTEGFEWRAALTDPSKKKARPASGISKPEPTDKEDER